MRLRLSLRMLFLVTTIVAAACYWLILPTVKAQHFVRAVASQNYELADAYFHNSSDQFLFDWNDKHWRFKAEAEVEPWSFDEAMRGERRVSLQVMFGDAGPIRTGNWTITATRGGLLSPNPSDGDVFAGSVIL